MDHELSNDLWAANNINHRLLGALVIDKKQISSHYLEALIEWEDRRAVSSGQKDGACHLLLETELVSGAKAKAG